jgi:hypothetical protein
MQRRRTRNNVMKHDAIPAAHRDRTAAASQELDGHVHGSLRPHKTDAAVSRDVRLSPIYIPNFTASNAASRSSGLNYFSVFGWYRGQFWARR